ncbi:MAG: aminotransferase class V-fold PLP-dependent enzyme, partial [Clostridia bacterium]|nr:aminotransferase class V-fold PLP-dependent enzyme [Clostridia bacterium]
MDRIYLDHSATTAVDSRVLQKMLPYFTEIYGNANSQHSYGRDALKGVDWARDTIASLIGAKSSEVYFTSGGTEADNWALKGIAEAYKDKGKKIIMSSIEHHAMLATGKQLQDAGYTVLYAPVNNKGIVDLEYLKQNVTEDTLLVSVMLVNNEIGTIQPIKEIVKLCKEKGVLVHTDAVQAMSSL